MTKSINGVLLLDKPLGISSNHALQRVKRLLNAKKAGHTGSLDPLASGMLPICFGEATKYSRYFLEADKCYEFTLSLGTTTTTGDAQGEILSTQPVPPIAESDISEMILHFQGQQTQVPPMFSALKYQGRPLYQLAREGISIPRAARSIVIHELFFKGKNTSQGQCALTFVVKCSKGTYVRVLAEDMGRYLGCGAHVIALRRLWADPFRHYPMMTLDALGSSSQENAYHPLLSIQEILAKMFPTLLLSHEEANCLYQGKTILTSIPLRAGYVLLVTPAEFIGMGELFEDGRVISKRLINQEIMVF